MRDSSEVSRGSGFVAFSKPEEASKAVSFLDTHTCMMHAHVKCITLLEMEKLISGFVFMYSDGGD